MYHQQPESLLGLPAFYHPSLVTDGDLSSTPSPPPSPSSSAETSEDVSLFGAALGARAFRPTHRRAVSSAELSRRNAISGNRKSSASSRRSSSRLSPTTPLTPLTAFDAEDDVDTIRAVPASPTLSAAPPTVRPLSINSRLTLEQRLHKPYKRRPVSPPDLTELSDSDIENDDFEEEHAELFARAADLLRVRVTATVEAQRLARLELRRSNESDDGHSV